MKKFFVLAFVATSFALVSCGSSETAETKVDTAVVAAPVVDTVKVADTTAAAPVDTTKK